MLFRLGSSRYLAAGSLVLAVGAGIGGFYWWKRKKDFDQKEAQETAEHQTKQKGAEELAARLQPHLVKVSGAKLDTYIKAPGIVDFHPKHALRIHPTYPGVIDRVYKNLGDSVNAGEALASVESNIGIQVFAITSPIKGIVLSKSAGEGQSVGPEEELFSVGDTAILQARLSVSARDVKLVKMGSEVELVDESFNSVRSTIQFLSPILTDDTRTATAIVDFQSDNLRPGMFVTGAIVTGVRDVPLSVPLSFCRGNPGIYSIMVLGPKGVENRNVTIGASDYNNCEVLQGLQLNEEIIPNAAMALLSGKGEVHGEADAVKDAAGEDHSPGSEHSND